MQGAMPQTVFYTTLIPINDKLTSNHECYVHTEAGAFAARSRHPGGVNVAMGDGSVQFASANIDIFVWRASSTMRGQPEVNFPGF